MIKANFVNTTEEFKWCLEYGEATSEWYSHYSGLLTWKAPNGKLYGLATAYWQGSLPIEVPFEIAEVENN